MFSSRTTNSLEHMYTFDSHIYKHKHHLLRFKTTQNELLLTRKCISKINLLDMDNN